VELLDAALGRLGDRTLAQLSALPPRRQPRILAE
jgi:hypothetical protein